MMTLPVGVRLQPGDLTVAEAIELTGRIRQTGERFAALITSAWRGRVWVALGYESWAEWLDTELPGMALPQDERKQVVAELRAEGMSTRAIGAAVGVDQKTVVNDLRREENSSPDAAVTTPSNVIGLDGKTYTRPAPVPLTAAQQHDIEVARRVRLVEQAISHWPHLYGLRQSGMRDEIIARLCDSDREQLRLIEARIK